jgi:hypothetical protein
MTIANLCAINVDISYFMKEINVVYPAHDGAPDLHHSCELGKVWLSKDKRNDIPNVFTSWYACNNPGPTDNLIMLEPIVTHPYDYHMNWLSKFNKVFGCFSEVFKNTEIENKFIEVNYGSSLSNNSPENVKNSWRKWNERKNGVIIVAGGKSSNHEASIYELRVSVADALHDSGIEVAWFGGLPNRKKRPYFKGHVQNKIEEINKYRFHLCSENTYHKTYSHNYFTEKFPHAILGGSIPIYMGCYNIDDFASKELFIDLRNHVTNKVVNAQSLVTAINSYDEDSFNNYHDLAFNYMKDDKGLFYHTDMHRYYRKMLEVL